MGKILEIYAWDFPFFTHTGIIKIRNLPNFNHISYCKQILWKKNNIVKRLILSWNPIGDFDVWHGYISCERFPTYTHIGQYGVLWDHKSWEHSPLHFPTLWCIWSHETCKYLPLMLTLSDELWGDKAAEYHSLSIKVLSYLR